MKIEYDKISARDKYYILELTAR